MPYNLDYSTEARQRISKACKKNRALGIALEKKIAQVLHNPYHFKPLHAPLQNQQNQRRVHIFKSFVLTYEIIEPERIVKIINFRHHDNASK